MTEATQQTPQRPGQMTAVMRAVAAAGPKVLRIGVVQNGRVIEERVIRERADVSVGPSEKSTFVLSVAEMPRSHVLFQLQGEGYVLNFLDGMAGRVALPTGVSDLDQLKGQARRSDGGSYQIRLTEDSRGKVLIGETTFLFQFVAPPPVQPRPQLPVAVTRGATGVDWRTTIIAAFAFLAHFMAIGAMYSDWLDPVIDEQLSLAGLVDSLDQLPPPPPPEEQPTEEVTPDKTATPEKAEVKQASPSSTKSVADGASGKLNSAQAAALSNELEQLSMATLAALGSAGPATEGVLRGSDVPTGALDAAAASGAGVGVGGDLKLGGGGGTVRPGMGGSSLGSIGSTGKGESGTGTSQAVAGPQGSANVSSSMAAGSVSNANKVVAGMRAGFRRCYQRALDQNPDVAGSIKLTIRVGPGGEVTGVTASPSGNLPDSVVTCVKSRAQAAEFAPPDGGSAAINVPVTFVKQ